MKVKYFTDTDTALVEFMDAPVNETRELSENIYIDFDIAGNIISMTIEHAHKAANMSEFVYQQVEPERRYA